jgi:hypothetical protein
LPGCVQVLSWPANACIGAGATPACTPAGKLTRIGLLSMFAVDRTFSFELGAAPQTGASMPSKTDLSCSRQLVRRRWKYWLCSSIETKRVTARLSSQHALLRLGARRQVQLLDAVGLRLGIAVQRLAADREVHVRLAVGRGNRG